jgi:hypothetical protein
MDTLTDLDTETVLSGRCDWLDAETVSLLAAHPLDGLATEFPHHAHPLDGPGAVERPSERHPVFFGCYDWHSAVHSHWALVRQLRLVDDHPDETAIVESFDRRLTPENVAVEATYLDANPAFEKPYGWAWLLHLAAELDRWEDPRADEWRTTLRPLETQVVSLVETEFLTQERPFRVGTHANSAFSLHCTLDYARSVGDDALAAAVCETARDFYADDTAAPLDYEPLDWDFLSPSFTEADLMRRVLDPVAFGDWVRAFLPDLLAADEPGAALPEPIQVDASPDEGIALHFVGLNLARAWSMVGVADALADEGVGDEAVVSALEASAADHARAGLGVALTDDYAGSHWLSSFALYLLSRNEGGIAQG